MECNCGRWTAGSVVKLFYTQSSFPPNSCAPYQIKLDDGRLIFAPADEDRVIRRATGAASEGSVQGADALEEDDEPERPDSEKLCVTVVTGFLGAGARLEGVFFSRRPRVCSVLAHPQSTAPSPPLQWALCCRGV